MKPADVQDSFRIHGWGVAAPQDVVVANSFAFLRQPLAEPPDQRMKPKERFDEHVNGRGEVVPVANVADFMRQDRLELLRREAIRDAFGNEYYRP
jgi:hypothetical protein